MPGDNTEGSEADGKRTRREEGIHQGTDRGGETVLLTVDSGELKGAGGRLEVGVCLGNLQRVRKTPLPNPTDKRKKERNRNELHGNFRRGLDKKRDE